MNRRGLLKALIAAPLAAAVPAAASALADPRKEYGFKEYGLGFEFTEDELGNLDEMRKKGGSLGYAAAYVANRERLYDVRDMKCTLSFKARQRR